MSDSIGGTATNTSPIKDKSPYLHVNYENNNQVRTENEEKRLFILQIPPVTDEDEEDDDDILNFSFLKNFSPTPLTGDQRTFNSQLSRIDFDDSRDTTLLPSDRENFENPDEENQVSQEPEQKNSIDESQKIQNENSPIESSPFVLIQTQFEITQTQAIAKSAITAPRKVIEPTQPTPYDLQDSPFALITTPGSDSPKAANSNEAIDSGNSKVGETVETSRNSNENSNNSISPTPSIIQDR